MEQTITLHRHPEKGPSPKKAAARQGDIISPKMLPGCYKDNAKAHMEAKELKVAANT